MMALACLNCRRPYPVSGVPFRCAHCGGLFDDSEPLPAPTSRPGHAGIWQYIEPPDADTNAEISLGEGGTPLLAADWLGAQIYFKCEYTNPSGSFKDRGSAVLVSLLKSRRIPEAFEDSSGNAGASFAAYAARAAVRATVYIPEEASGPKRRQIEAYGAHVVAVAGGRAATANVALRAADSGGVYASHAYLPHNLAGYATCAFEICEQMGRAPGTVIVPAGQGGFLLGMGRGFEALHRFGRIDDVPALFGVQAAACAPLAALAAAGLDGLALVTEGPTLAEGVRVRTPLRAEAVLRMAESTGGRMLAVAEDQILPGRDALARLGFYVEPTSALVWGALAQVLPEVRQPIVAVLTGSGYKVAN